MRVLCVLLLAVCASVALAQSSCTTSSCQQKAASVILVPITQAPTCAPAVQQSTCCKTKQDTCCSKPCYVEPEYKPEECQRRSVTVCCSQPKQTCCNMGCATFLEDEAVATTQTQAETEQCPEIVRISTCCQAGQTNGCCNPQKTCQAPPPASKIGDMKMGLLKLPNCTLAVNDRPCCTKPRTDCCVECNRQLVKAELAPTSTNCPPVASRPCCTATVLSCCNPCAASAAVAPAPSLVEAEAEQCTTCAVLAPQKPMVPAKVLGKCDAPPCSQTVTVTVPTCTESVRTSTCCTKPADTCCKQCPSTSQVVTVTVPSNSCSDSVKAMACCAKPTDTCCSKPCTYIGQMQMGKLCDQQRAQSTCCSSATLSCCNRQLTC